MLNHSSGSFVTLEIEGQFMYIASGYSLCSGCVLQIKADEAGHPGSLCIQENCTVSRNSILEYFCMQSKGSVLMRAVYHTLHLSNELQGAA